MQNMPIGIFRGDDTDAFSYQTIVGTINTDLDLTGCKAVFRYLGFSMEFDPIPEDKKLTIVIPANETKKFPPGLGYASLRVYDSEGRLKTFSNRIMVFVATKTPMFGSDEFEVDFNVRATLEPLKFFVGPNPDDFDEYRGYLEKVIDRASAAKYGLAILLDAIDSDLGAKDGVAATPVAVKAAYAAIIEKLTNDYYTAEQTDEAIDRVAAYYITRNAAGDAFETKAQLDSATVFYSGGKVRTPTRNDYCVVLADETYDNAEYRYIYAVADGETTGSWQPQFPVEGVMTVDQTVQENSPNPVSGGGVWSAIWGAASTTFASLYDWCVAQLAGKQPRLTPAGVTALGGIKTVWAEVKHQGSMVLLRLPTELITINGTPLSSDVTLTGADIAVSGSDATKINAAIAGKASKADATLTPIYSDTPTYSEWTCKVDGRVVVPESITYDEAGAWTFDFGPEDAPIQIPGDEYSTELTKPIFGDSTFTATRTRTDILGYQLGNDDQHILASEAEAEALRTGKANRAANPTEGNLAALDANGNPTDSTISAENVALKGNIPYDLGAPTTIDSNSVQTDETDPNHPITYATVTLLNRTANRVQVLVAIDELRVVLPASTEGKVRDLGLTIVVGNGTAALAAPALVVASGIELVNPDGAMPELADGTVTMLGITLLYFSEVVQSGFLVKGEQVQPITQ